MRYLCAVYVEPSVFDTMSETERTTLDRDSLAYDMELQKSGHYLHADALQPVNTARTVRVRRGKVSQTDGPFADSHLVERQPARLPGEDAERRLAMCCRTRVYSQEEIGPSGSEKKPPASTRTECLCS